LQYHVILDEAVLTRPIGSAAVMRGQLAKLAGAIEAKQVTLQVLPSSAGAKHRRWTDRSPC